MAEIWTSADELELFFYQESTFGNGPVDDSSDWNTQESAGNAFAIRAISADPAPIRQGFLVDPTLRRRYTESFAPIKGLRSDADFSFSVPMHGAESETSAASQVAQTGLGELLANALGGSSQNNTTAVAAGPSSDVSFDLDSGTNYAVGQILFVEDADDTDRLFGRRVETLSGASVTLSHDQSTFNVAENDEVHGADTAYIDTDALARGGSGYATYSILINRNGQCWEATGCKIKLESITFERGQVPVCNFVALLGHVRPFNDGAPSAPTTVTPEGGPYLAWGIDSYFHLQTHGTTTTDYRHVDTITVSPGIEIARIPNSTTDGSRPEGLSGYTVTAVNPTIEITTTLDGDLQDNWDSTTYQTVGIGRVGPPGSAFHIHAPRVTLMEPPTATNLDGGIKMYACKYQLLEDTTDTTNFLTRSNLLIGRG